jgi:hypothetical protein
MYKKIGKEYNRLKVTGSQGRNGYKVKEAIRLAGQVMFQ